MCTFNVLWKPLIPYGENTIIEGDGGDEKTTMILTIAVMMSNGIAPPALERGHLLPSVAVEPITIFYLTSEDEFTYSSMVRFLRAGGDAHRIEDEVFSAIEESKCRILINKLRTIFTTLANEAKKTGIAIVLIGHLNKNEGGKDIHKGFGSADIAVAVRSIIIVEMSKSNFDEADYTPIRLILDEERKLSFSEFDDDEGVLKTRIEIAMEIISELLEKGPQPVYEVNAACAEEGIGSKTAQRARKLLGIKQDYIDGVTVWMF